MSESKDKIIDLPSETGEGQPNETLILVPNEKDTLRIVYMGIKLLLEKSPDLSIEGILNSKAYENLSADQKEKIREAFKSKAADKAA